MGMSKAMMEKLMLAKSISNKENSVFCHGYGNVMCSRLVIPLFVSQIKSNNSITITDPNDKVSNDLDQSVDLVMHALRKV